MPKLFYKDLWGKRADKYKFLESNDISTVNWQELNSLEPYHFFVPKDFSLKEEYEKFWSVKDIFIQFSSGVKTHRDHFIVGFTKEEVANKIRIFTGTLDDETVKESLKLKDTTDWKLSDARTKLKNMTWKELSDLFIPYSYRPFDNRYICYCRDLIDRDRYDLMKYFFKENMGLVLMRKLIPEELTQVFVSQNILDINFYAYQTYIFPLYLYQTDEIASSRLLSGLAMTENSNPPQSPFKKGGIYNTPLLLKGGEGGLPSRKIPNFKPEFLNAIKNSLGFEPAPEDIFHYIYAVLYSPTYRSRYQEFLKIDFPRIPLPDQFISQKSPRPPFTKWGQGGITAFKRLSELGKRLVDLHLLKDTQAKAFGYPYPESKSEISNLQSTITVGYPVQGTDKVEKIKYLNGRVYINKEQYFENIIEDVWNYHIGSYKVMEKFLKDRKGRRLSLDEIQRYLKIISSIAQTIELQKEVDRIWQT